MTRARSSCRLTSAFRGGLLGTFSAALLEPLFIRQLDFATAFIVGLIEELAKILGVLVVARHRRHDEGMDGLLLGAAAGMGLATLESTGYAFTAVLASGGSLSATVGVTLLRGLLVAVGPEVNARRALNRARLVQPGRRRLQPADARSDPRAEP